MAEVSPYAPEGADCSFDMGTPCLCQYLAADLLDGRYGVFVVHRNTREWWRRDYGVD